MVVVRWEVLYQVALGWMIGAVEEEERGGERERRSVGRVSSHGGAYVRQRWTGREGTDSAATRVCGHMTRGLYIRTELWTCGGILHRLRAATSPETDQYAWDVAHGSTFGSPHTHPSGGPYSARAVPNSFRGGMAAWRHGDTMRVCSSWRVARSACFGRW